MKHVATTHADVFSYGIVLAEMIHPCSSFMEREQVLLLFEFSPNMVCINHFSELTQICPFSSSVNFTLKLFLYLSSVLSSLLSSSDASRYSLNTRTRTNKFTLILQPTARSLPLNYAQKNPLLRPSATEILFELQHLLDNFKSEAHM
jgi:hypothetical protein